MKRFLYILIIFICVAEVKGYSQTFWNRYSPSWDIVNSFQVCDDGGAIATTTSSLPAGFSLIRGAIIIFRIDQFGDTVWTKQFDDGDSSSCFASKIIKTSDSCFVVVGRWSNFSNNLNLIHGVSLIKIDLSGNIKWTKVLSPNCCGLYSYSQDIFETKDNGFIIVNEAGDNSGFHPFILLLKTDSIGQEVWSKTIKSVDGLVPLSVKQLSDSGYVILSKCIPLSTNFYNTLLIRTNPIGNIIWSKTSSDSLNWARSLNIENDSSPIFSFANGIYKLSLNGSITYSKNYIDLNKVSIQDFSICNNSDYIITGNIVDSFYNYTPFLMRTDQSGQVLWTRRYNNNENFSAIQVCQTISNDFIFSCNYDSINNSIFFNDIIKTDSLGFINCPVDTTPFTIDSLPKLLINYPLTVDTCSSYTSIPTANIRHVVTYYQVCTSTGINSNVDENELMIFPNPSDGKISIKSSKNNFEVCIFDMLGSKTKEFSYVKSNQEIDLSNQPKGIYFCRIIFKNETGKTFKIILQ